MNAPEGLTDAQRQEWASAMYWVYDQLAPGWLTQQASEGRLDYEANPVEVVAAVRTDLAKLARSVDPVTGSRGA